MAPKKDDIRQDGMFQDGTNPESVDPVPSLNWRSKEDIKDVVVYGLRASPAVAKILCFLKFYHIPFTFKKGVGKKGSKYYKKMPVIDVAGRQVNDSFVIMKNLIPAVSGQDFNEEWEKRITFEYMSSMVVNATDAEIVQNFKAKGSDSPMPRCMVGCVIPRIRPKGVKALKERAEDPNEPIKLIDMTEFAKEFAAAMQGWPFFGGAEPGPVDVSFFGVNGRFVCIGTDCAVNALEAAGLMPWFRRMEEKIPLMDRPGAVFE